MENKLNSSIGKTKILLFGSLSIVATLLLAFFLQDFFEENHCGYPTEYGILWMEEKIGKQFSKDNWCEKIEEICSKNVTTVWNGCNCNVTQHFGNFNYTVELSTDQEIQSFWLMECADKSFDTSNFRFFDDTTGLPNNNEDCSTATCDMEHGCPMFCPGWGTFRNNYCFLTGDYPAEENDGEYSGGKCVYHG